MKVMLVALLLGGCAVDAADAAASSDPPASTAPAPASPDLRAAIDSDLGNVIASTSAAITATTANLPGAMSAGTLAQLFGSSAAAVHQVLAPLAARLAWPGGGDSSNAMSWLDANVLSAPVGNGVYAIPASLVCGEPASAECAASVAQAQPRVRVAAASGGVQLFVQLGAAHDEPLAITLTGDELTATVDLDAAGRDLGAPFSGTASLDLKVAGPAHVTATLAFGAPIAVGWGGASLSSAAGSPLTIDLDGSRPQIAATLAFGATTIEVADTKLTVPALGAQVGFDGHALTLDRISLGGSSAILAKAGQQAIAIDLNPNAGRTFGAVLSTNAGVETIAVAPSLEIRQQIDHGVLGDGAPVYDVTDLSLDAALHGSAGSDEVEVVHGSYGIATSPASYGVTATDARCVVATPATTSSGQSYDQLAVATCQ